MKGPRILLVVGGGIAAYKACELVRTIRKNGGEVTCVLTEAGAKFVTPMALAALSENPVHTTLWDLKDEVEMGHIQLSREADLVVICPATANLLAKMASGIADDLATTLLLATDKPVMAIPAMNVRMWEHASTQRNVEMLRSAGVDVMDPDEGPMACGEFGPGRLPEPNAVWNRIAWALDLPESVLIPEQPEIRELPGPAEPQEEEVVDYAADPDAALARIGSEGPSEPGGLSASLISRGLQKAKEAIGLASHEPEIAREELPPPDAEEPPAEEVEVDPNALPAGGGLLSVKGKARAAPPTDPEAINHLVSGDPDAAAPEPFEEEMRKGEDGAGDPVVPEAAADDAALAEPADPLDGQPDFDADPEHRPLYGKHVLVTAGPTWEPIDPVRYIANRSSGQQGFAIAAAAKAAGARVTLVSGPVHLETPPGVERIDVESAMEMAEEVKKALPADIAVMVAAVADWRPRETAEQKIKKRGSAPPALLLTENPDILATVAGGRERPPLLIGFAAETEDVVKHAKEKRKRKGADWIIANDVSGNVMGGSDNAVHIVSSQGVESLPEMSKTEVARILVERFVDALAQ